MQPSEFDPHLPLHAARDTIEHVSLALGLTDGMDSEASRQLMTELITNPSMVEARAEEALRHWQTRQLALASVTEEYRSRHPVANRATLGQLQPYLLEEMLLASGTYDHNDVMDLIHGFPITGSIPAETRVYLLTGVVVYMANQALEGRFLLTS